MGKDKKMGKKYFVYFIPYISHGNNPSAKKRNTKSLFKKHLVSLGLLEVLNEGVVPLFRKKRGLNFF